MPKSNELQMVGDQYIQVIMNGKILIGLMVMTREGL